MATSLFAPVAQAKDSLVEFRAGIMREDAQKWVRPDERKGLVQLKRGAEDGLIHFVWKDRNSGATELDLIIFPDEAVFRKVEEAKAGSRVFILQFKNGSTKRHFFWMQEPKTDKDDETVKKLNQYMNNPPEEGSEGAGAEGGGLNNQMLMQMLGGMPQLRRGAAGKSASAASPAAAPAAAPAASTTTAAPAPAARTAATSTPAAAAPAAQGGDAMRAQLTNLLQGMIPALGQQREEGVSLGDVLNTDELLKTGILADPAVRSELEQHLPPVDQGSALAATLRTPQFRQCVETFNAALSSGALPELLASFGLPASSEPSASNLEAFLRAVQAKADKEKKDAEKKMTEHIEAQVPKDLLGTEFPKDAEGRVYHFGAKRGEIANRCLFVGDPHRAGIIKNMLDEPDKCYSRASTRGFLYYTGKKNGVPVSIVATGMGYPMMDFAVRELRAVVDGPMAIVRLGSCGSPSPQCPVGTTVVASQCVQVNQKPEGLWEADSTPHDSLKYYHVSDPVSPNDALHKLLFSTLSNVGTGLPVFEGITASCDSYYAAQGRVDPNFDDRNEQLIDQIMEKHHVMAIEMETFHLMHLARISKGSIHAAGCAFVMAQRKSQQMMNNATKERIEKLLGEGCLKALVEYPIDEQKLMKGSECVWNH